MTDAPAIKQNANGIYFLEGEQLWDSDILPVCLEHIKEGDTVIDAGAWIGGHTMAYAEKIGGRNVHAFEPNPLAYICLRDNTPLGTHTYNVALSDKSGHEPMSGKIGWQDSNYIGGDMKLYDVQVETLDSYGIAPNFIKIDVEGCELKVLKGAVKTIEKHRPIMVIEVNRTALERQGSTPEEVFTWLEQHRYGWEVIKSGEHNSDIYNILAAP